MKQGSLEKPLNRKEIEGHYELPAGWRWVRLGEVLKEPLKNGLNYRKEDFGAGIKFVNVSDIFCPDIINTQKLDRIKPTFNTLFSNDTSIF